MGERVVHAEEAAALGVAISGRHVDCIAAGVPGGCHLDDVGELRIGPEGSAVLKPGGLHLMLMQPHKPLKAGSKVAIEFELHDGGLLRGEFIVRKPAD